MIWWLVFLSIPTTTKFNKEVKYIHDDKSWEMCYVQIKILFLDLDSFAWQIVILQEWKKFITIRE